MARNETARPRVLLDSKEAMNKLKALEDQAEQLKQAIREAGKDNNTEAQRKLQSQLKKTNREIKDLKIEARDVNNVLANLSGASMNDLRGAAQRLKREMNSLNRESGEFATKQKQYNLINNELRNINSTAKKTNSIFSKGADFFNKYSASIVAAVGAVTGFVMIMRGAADLANKFESAVGNLQALTGLAGDELKWLADKAKETSVATVEGGVHIKQSAEDIVQAYKLVGSQRPDLLQNKEALHEVTEKAIILSEAAAMDLEPSVKALAGTLNQFNLNSNESSRVINILAAGSQAGAADIEYLSTAIEKSGTTAAIMGISVEEATGVIEAIAPKFTDASQAGNSFDKVLLKMKTKSIGYTNGVFNINDAIDELRERFAKGESSVSIFGERHAKLAEILIQSQDQVNYFTEAVTNTDKAIEQATINTTDNASALKQAQNRFKLVAMEVGERFAPALTFSTNAGTKLIRAIFALIEVFKKYGDLILGATAAIVGYYTAVKVADLWEKRSLLTKKAIALTESKNIIISNAGAIALRLKILLTRQSTTAEVKAIATTKALNATMKANPIGLIIGALAVAIPLIIRAVDWIGKAKISVDELKKTNEEAAQNISMERMIDRYEQLKNKTNKTAAEQREYNELLRDLSTVADKGALVLDDLGNVIDINTDKLRKMNNELKTSNLIQFEKDLAQAKNEIEKLNESIKGDQSSVISYDFRLKNNNLSNAEKDRISKLQIATQKAIEKSKEELVKYTAELNKLQYQIDLLSGTIEDPFDKFRDILGEITTKEIPELENLKTKLNEALTYAPDDEEFVKAVKSQIDRVNEELKRIGGTQQGDYFDINEFKNLLSKAKTQYEEYEKVKTYLTKEQEQERYGEQLKQGANYQAFLRYMAEKHKGHTDALIEIYKEFEQKKHNNAKSWEERLFEFRKKYNLIKNQELFEIERAEILRSKEYFMLTTEEKLELSKGLYTKYFGDLKKMQNNTTDEELPEFADVKAPEDFEMDYETQKYADSLQGRKDLLREFYEDGVIQREEYNDKMDMLIQEQTQSYASHYDNVMGSFSQILQAQQMANTRKMNQELKDAEGNEAKQEEIRKKYGKKQKAYELKMAYISFGSAVLNAMTMRPWPLALAAVLAATIMADEQIKTIKSQEFYDGGFTTQTQDDKQAVGVVHANEFVANARAVQNPTVKPYLDAIDLAQKNGSIATIDFNKVIPAMNSQKAFKTGGYTTTAQSQQSQQQPTANVVFLDAKSIELLSQAVTQSERPIILTPESIKRFTEIQNEIVNVRKR